MKVNDALFDRTSMFFNTLLCLWTFGYILPLGIQILFSGEENVHLSKLCNAVCLTIILIFHSIEMLTCMQQGLRQYVQDVVNLCEQVYFFVYYYYFSFRMNNLSRTILPLDHPFISVADGARQVVDDVTLEW